MTATHRPSESELDDEEPLLPRRGDSHHVATFDITAMIDLVFMLNIFFLVTTVVAVSAELDLPIVRHAVPTDPDDAIIISIVAPDPQSVIVSITDNKQGGPLLDPEDQLREVRQAVEEASRSGKHVVLLKAERAVKLKDVKRIGAAAIKGLPNMELRMAVIERE